MQIVAKLYGKLGFPKSLFGISWAEWDLVGFLWVSLGFCGLIPLFGLGEGWAYFTSWLDSTNIWASFGWGMCVSAESRPGRVRSDK